MADQMQSHQFFQNTACEFFPCHGDISAEDFNCLFCFCPLYALGRACGGNCTYTEKGRKSCTECSFPHERKNYDAVLARYGDIAAVVKLVDGEK
ncbi:MAG: cysteine-rich small domain-containing protein [Clostridia bacterium]|nr:cysteine-rich small domain-containing protein [Clostridia bacterium]